MPMPYVFGLPLPTIMVIISIIIAGVIRLPPLKRIMPLRLISALSLFLTQFSWMTWGLMEIRTTGNLELSFRCLITIIFLGLCATEVHFATENKNKEKKLVGKGGKELAIVTQAKKELRKRGASNPPKDTIPEKSIREQLSDKRNKKKGLVK